jgi:hypothetical protein
MNVHRLRLVLAVLCVGILSGCGTTYLLDNQVQAFSGLAALPAQPTYRFDRLPSQQQPAQAQLEALADAALHRAGLRRDDAAPVFTVLVSARIQRALSPWADPWDWHWGGGFLSPFGRMQQAWFVREVTLVVRELAGNRVVFESRALNEGPWLPPTTVVPAMFDAALQGFPNAPAGVRRVDIQLGAR